MADTYYEEPGVEQRQPAYQDLFGLGEEGHLTDKDMFGVKEAIWDIDIDPGMTLETLAADHPDGYLWKLSEEELKQMRHNTRLQDRRNATEEDYEGSIRKGLFLSAELISDQNDTKVKLNVDIESMLPCTFTGKGRSNWTIQGNCPQGRVFNKESIFDPNSYFTRRMYEKQQLYNKKTLERDIKMTYDASKEWIAMPLDGVGWEKVMDNWHNPAFKEVNEIIQEKNKHIFAAGEEIGSGHSALVPYALGEAIFEYLSEPLEKIEKSFVDFSKLRVKFTRKDGEAWNSPKGMVGDSQSYGKDAVGVETQHNLHKPIAAGLTIRVKYVLEE